MPTVSWPGVIRLYGLSALAERCAPCEPAATAAVATRAKTIAAPRRRVRGRFRVIIIVRILLFCCGGSGAIRGGLDRSSSCGTAERLPGARNVGLGRALVADRHPEHEAAVQLRVRDEDLARGVDALHERLVLLVR